VNRALRAATVGVLLLTPLALTACGAGQVDQTASQVRDKTGPSAQIGDLYLREVQLAAPSGGSYAPGDDAELTMSIVNGGSSDDALVGIRGDGFTGVRVAGTGSSTTATGSAASATPATPAATPTATVLPPGATPAATTPATPGATTPATATGAATGTSSATGTSAPATPTAAPATPPSSTVNIPIPAHQAVFLGQNAPTVTVVGLRQSLTSAQLLKVTFTFRRAGEVTVDVVVAAPTNPAPPSTTYDFSKAPSPVFGPNG
jgi:copper(I)-binding protein